MTAQGAGGAGRDVWLDMSRYPDTDPDAVLTGAEQDLLSSSLTVDDGELPDAVWEHMLAVVTGPDAGADDADDADDGDATDPPGDAPAGWDADPTVEVHDDGDPGGEPAELGDAWEDGAWDGGAV
ncbi:hypothetical protein [Actinomycetospora cinnamomea]|uniref:Uncharacterized protein n=1 Tax=Actinomycetospora cinnamomea TaxID=663609 RepID=A0A2U1FCR9_9PSEU|nr:hypothetical protein [Actinomycetospora cinnamomea]PVZ09956.1 hypothetical protein C8D89_10529 [Actinomycetospora cinnamomea]